MTKGNKFKGEPMISRFLGGTTLIGITVLGIGALITLKISGIIVGIILLFIVFFVLTKVINEVEFIDEYVIVNYAIGKQKKVRLDSIYRIYKNKEGFIPAEIYVLRYKLNGNEKKITLSCSDSSMIEIRDCYLPNKRIHESKP